MILAYEFSPLFPKVLLYYYNRAKDHFCDYNTLDIFAISTGLKIGK
jgi:hypothetical protein